MDRLFISICRKWIAGTSNWSESGWNPMPGYGVFLNRVGLEKQIDVLVKHKPMGL